VSSRGSAEQIADTMQEWFTAGGCDGFDVTPSHLPGALDDFVDLVVPLLRERGVFHADHDGSETLREGLGLGRPASRHAVSEPATV